MKRVAAVILNYNGKKWLEKFLPSVLASTYPNLEIVVADNCSTDDSVKFLTQTYPQITLIQNKVNGGYAKGYNDCLKLVNADYYILLNSDIEVTPSWIEPIISLMETAPQVAACQPKIRMFDQKNLFEYAGASGGFMDNWGYMFCRGRIFDTLEEDLGQYDDSHEIFWATGACLFIRASAFHEVGGLYEPLFAHMEEIDLCWRLKNIRYKIYVCPSSIIYHVGGGTLHKSNPHKTYLNFRNNLIILWRNWTSFEKFAKFPTRIMFDLLALLVFLSKRNTGDAKAIIKAYRHFLGRIRKWSREAPEHKNMAHSAVFQGSIIWQYYVSGKKKFSELIWRS